MLKKVLVALPGLVVSTLLFLASVGPDDIRTHLKEWAQLGRLSLPPWWVIGGLTAFVAVGYVAAFVVWRRHSRGYLPSAQPALSDAVQAMAFRSAWGKEFRARQLANAGRFDDFGLMQQAAALVTRALRNKPDLIVEGASSPFTGYRPIPQAIWQSLDLLPMRDQDGKWHVEPIPVPTADQYALRDVLSLNQRRIPAKPFLEEYPLNHSLADQNRRNALAEATARGVDRSLINHVLNGTSPLVVQPPRRNDFLPPTSSVS